MLQVARKGESLTDNILHWLIWMISNPISTYIWKLKNLFWGFGQDFSATFWQEQDDLQDSEVERRNGLVLQRPCKLMKVIGSNVCIFTAGKFCASICPLKRGRDGRDWGFRIRGRESKVADYFFGLSIWVYLEDAYFFALWLFFFWLCVFFFASIYRRLELDSILMCFIHTSPFQQPRVRERKQPVIKRCLGRKCGPVLR